MQTNTKQILSVLQVVSWITFIGLCIQTGAHLTSFFISLFVNAEAAKNLYQGLDLSALYAHSQIQFIAVESLIISTYTLQAYCFFLVIRIFMKTNFEQPFKIELANYISKVGWTTFFIGILGILTSSHAKLLNKEGIQIPQHWGSAEFLFMSGILFVIALIFKRGIEIQTENDLTI